MDNLYHCCRWCKWFEDGKCINSEFKIEESNIVSFYEEGHLADSIKEGFTDKKFQEVESLLSSSNLPKKKQKEILHALYEELESIKVDWVEEIDGQVSTALNNFDFGSKDGIEVQNSTEFHCKNFW